MEEESDMSNFEDDEEYLSTFFEEDEDDEYYEEEAKKTEKLVPYSFEIKEDFDVLVEKLRESMDHGLIREVVDFRKADKWFEVRCSENGVTISSLYTSRKERDDGSFGELQSFRDDYVLHIGSGAIVLEKETRCLEESTCDEMPDLWCYDHGFRQVVIRPKENGGCVVSGNIPYTELAMSQGKEVYWLFPAVRHEMAYVPNSFAVDSNADIYPLRPEEINDQANRCLSNDLVNRAKYIAFMSNALSKNR